MKDESMKVCLVGYFADEIDEGVRKVGFELARNLENSNINVKKVNVSPFGIWKEIYSFQPDIIHFILSPTLSGLIFSKLVGIVFSKLKVIVSAIHPSIPNLKIVKLFKPDLLLVQSSESEKLFTNLGFNSFFLPNGIDITKFHPISKDQKNILRKKYDIPLDKFVIIHLASLKKERNIEICTQLKINKDYQVIIIGREHEAIDFQLVDKLKDSGCKLWIKHFPNIEEIYNIADLYFFPTIDKTACIETPLSILEAMACNLPIITTKFGSLPRLFKENGNFFYFTDIDELIKKIEILRKTADITKTRKKVIPYSWENIINQMKEEYIKLIQ